MEPLQQQQPQIDFDLSWIHPRERFPFWHDVGSLVQRPAQERYQEPASLMVRAKILSLGEIVMGQMTSSPQHFERTAMMIRRDHIDSFLLVLLKSGSMHWAGEQSQFQMKAGDLFLLDQHESFRSDWSEHQQLYAALPRDLLAAAGWPEPRTALLHDGDPRADLLRQHLIAIWQQQVSGTAAMSATNELSLGLASLTRIYFSAPGSALSAEPEAQQHALISSIQQWLDNNLHRSDLDASTIAAAFHLSRSTLYEMFKPWGGIRTYLQARRLDIARHTLESADPRLSISQLAIRLGFRSVSSFSRAFHARWGMPPKQARQSARSQTQPAPATEDENAMREGTQRYYRAVQRLSRSQA
jgi:AraC-like DNA-binding protein